MKAPDHSPLDDLSFAGLRSTRPRTQRIRKIVIHTSGGIRPIAGLYETLRSRTGPKTPDGLSAHYLVGTDPATFALLTLSDRHGCVSHHSMQSAEGYLFWLAWAQHMAIQLFSTSDANGVFRPVTIAAPCATIVQTIRDQPETEFLQMLTPILTESKACGK